MIHSLNVAQTGLDVAQANAENVSNNLANVNTEGYKKRVVDVSEARNSDGRLTGRGVNIDGVTRITNQYLYNSVIGEASKESGLSELSNLLENIEAIFFETEDSGFSKSLDDFFQATEDLKSNPANNVAKNNFRSASQEIVSNIQNIYTELESLERDTKGNLNDNITNVNSIVSEIVQINIQIQNSITPTNDLFDKRDNLELELASYINVQSNDDFGYSLSAGNIDLISFSTNQTKLSSSTVNTPQKDAYVTDNNTNPLSIPTLTANDTITYRFNKDIEISVAIGENIPGFGIVTANNTVQALVNKINSSTLSDEIEAYNGQYALDQNGNKIPQFPTTQDHYLLIESKTKGFDAKFEGKLYVNDDNNLVNGFQQSYEIPKNISRSNKATTEVQIDSLGKQAIFGSGKIKALTDNLGSESSNNKILDYKEMLDSFVNSFVDATKSYISLGQGEYVSGQNASTVHPDSTNIKTINLFSGTGVSDFTFNQSSLTTITQGNLDYLSTLQWNEEIKFDKSANNATSITSFYQEIRFSVSSDKQNVDSLLETQESVTQALQISFDKLTKVNKDDELINLVKFQAAYEANAKMITVVDEMLQTLLAIKR